MKKVLTLLLVSFTLLGCQPKDEKTKIMNDYETLTTTDHVFDEVTLEELDEIVAEGNLTYVYFGSPKCGACVGTIGYLNKIAQEFGIKTIYYVDFDYRSDLSSEWHETGKYDYKGTPAVVVFDNGEFEKSYQSEEYANGPDLVSRMYDFLSDYSFEKRKIVSQYKTLTSVNHVFDEVSLSEFDEILATGDKVFAYFGSPRCGACVATMGELDKLAKEFGIDTIYYIYLDYSSPQAKEMSDENMYDYKGTPLVAVFENGEYVQNYYSEKYEEAHDNLVDMMRAFFTDFS